MLLCVPHEVNTSNKRRRQLPRKGLEAKGSDAPANVVRASRAVGTANVTRVSPVSIRARKGAGSTTGPEVGPQGG